MLAHVRSGNELSGSRVFSLISFFDPYLLLPWSVLYSPLLSSEPEPNCRLFPSSVQGRERSNYRHRIFTLWCFHLLFPLLQWCEGSAIHYCNLSLVSSWTCDTCPRTLSGCPAAAVATSPTSHIDLIVQE